ncbi:MAG TPA: ADP-ribosylglycohydrolase family protein [Chthoniobacteraceae bacterium]|jgi:ADP-ribosylglycohydrolase|nr:ADP-ribosylglycohydrolase family protein [Chthoniobacteraceae bacterium]
MSTPTEAAESARPVPMLEALAGVLVGTAVGDALGLPMEGLSARRQAKLFPPPLRHRFLGRRGMISDDTEHTLMVGQALLESSHDLAQFERALARRLRWWLASLPAGVGFATLRAILRLWSGTPPRQSGVWSAGNGPAMRSAVLGVFFVDDAVARGLFVQAATEITHRDPRALIAALAVAETAAWMAETRDDIDPLLDTLEGLGSHAEWPPIVARLRAALELNEPVLAFARELGATKGVSGYAFQSVPVAIYAALRHRGDYATAVGEVIACGGDTDTTGAITGALVGARVGTNGIPRDWRDGVADYPRSLDLLEQIAAQLERQRETAHALGCVRYLWPAVVLRNLVFLCVVLAHGLRRALPPY